MTATIDIDRMIEICFASQFFVYGFMAFALYPYNDYDTAQRMKSTESKPYLHRDFPQPEGTAEVGFIGSAPDGRQSKLVVSLLSVLSGALLFILSHTNDSINI